MTITLLKDFRRNKPHYVIAFLLLLLCAFIFFSQNYFKYNDEIGYDLLRSLSFNLLALGSFGLLFPLINHANLLIGTNHWPSRILYHVFFASGLIVSYAFVIGYCLYLLNFLSSPISNNFLAKYFLNMALIHLLFYLLMILFPFKQKGNETKPKYLTCSLKGKKTMFKISKIMWIEAFDHYVKIHYSDGYLLKRVSMVDILNQLNSTQFIRIHRSYIVNQQMINNVEFNGGQQYLVLTDGQSLKIGKTYRGLKLFNDDSLTNT